MISIIICSRNEQMLKQVAENVAVTIGVPYEIIAIDNSAGKYSICQAYNLGTQRSQYDTLCFMHEDISFETADWGTTVIRLFKENQKLGLLGVAGSSYKTAMPAGWSYPHADARTVYMNIVHHFKSEETETRINYNPTQELLPKVATVDGVWLCTRKSIAEKNPFDETSFRHFHCYDIDFSLAVLQSFEVAVTFEVVLKHFSAGNFDKYWVNETLVLHKKWKHQLPVNLAKLSKPDIAKIEFGAFHYLLPKIIDNKKLLISLLKYVWSINAMKLIGMEKFTFMNLLLVKKTV